MDYAKQNTNPENFPRQAVELWVDASSVAHLGIALNYHKLRTLVCAQLDTGFQKCFQEYSQGCYYAHHLPAPTSKKIVGKPDKQLQKWLQTEQQHAEAAGFILKLSTPWIERLPCMYCSCLNAVQFPAPSLLRLQSDLLQLFYSNAETTVYLLSNNAALLNNIFQLKGIELSKLKLIALDDSLETKGLEDVRQKAVIMQLDSAQIEQED